MTKSNGNGKLVKRPTVTRTDHAEIDDAMTNEEAAAYLDAAVDGKIEFPIGSADADAVETIRAAERRQANAASVLQQARAQQKAAEDEIQRALGEAEAAAKMLVWFEKRRRHAATAVSTLPAAPPADTMGDGAATQKPATG